MNAVERVADMPISDYRVKFTVRNNRLLSAIEAAGYVSQADFARAIDENPTSVSNLVAMRKAPVGASGAFTQCARKVMEALGACPSDLWSDDQLTMTLRKNSGEFTIDSKEIEYLRDRYIDAMTTEDPCELLERKDLTETLTRVTGKLKEQERKVLMMRFGLAAGQEMNLDGVGLALGVSSQRVRQIEERALRKLRHPAYSTEILLAAPDSFYETEQIERRRREKRLEELATENLADEKGAAKDSQTQKSTRSLKEIDVECAVCFSYNDVEFAWEHQELRFRFEPKRRLALCMDCAGKAASAGNLRDVIASLEQMKATP